MKFIHLSDLHLGIRFGEYSLIEDQEYILKTLLSVIDDEKPDGVLIAGDVYDKAVPSAEAVALFDDFLSALSSRRLSVFVISGNHDSPERIAFASRIMGKAGVYMSPVFGKIEPVVFSPDGHEQLNVYLLPFIKPVHARKYFNDEDIKTYTDAMKRVIDELRVDRSKRNLLIAHQYVTGARRSDSESRTVGGLDNVDASVFEPFDYVALGHLHSPQNCGSEKVRYCGTPLKYSFSEVKDDKSVTVVEFGKKGAVKVRTVPLSPLRDLADLKGTYDELMSRGFYEGKSITNDYVRVTLTDEDDVPDALAKLRKVYKNLVSLRYDNARTRRDAEVTGAADVENKTPFELFSDLYELRNNQPMTAEQEELVRSLIEKIWEGEK